MREYRRSVPAPAGLGLDLIGVPEGAPLALDSGWSRSPRACSSRARSRRRSPASAGGASNRSPTSCVVDVCELFAYPDSTTDETTEEDEVYRVDERLLDLEPVVRDAVVLALPWTPLCRPDCAGLCPTCGQRLDDLPAGHTHDQLDPRWAALAAVRRTGRARHEHHRPARSQE